jgi:methyl-accepting chemotaxis protein
MTPSESFAASVEARSLHFKGTFLRATSGSLTIAALAAIGLTLGLGGKSEVFIAATAAVLLCGTTFVLTREGRIAVGAYALTYGISAIAAYALFTGAAGASIVLMALALMVPVLGFLSTPSAALPLGGLGAAIVAGSGISPAVLQAAHDQIALNVVISTLLFLAYIAVMWMFLRHVSESAATLRDRLVDIDAVVVRAHRIADGDLAGNVEGTSEVSVVLRRMTDGLRELVEQIQRAATQLGSAATEIGAMTTQQSQSSVEQSSAVEETRVSLRSMLESSAQIANSAGEVLSNAERTLSTSETVGARVSTLAAHTERVTEILETIRDIANKAELLALNAALEGAKAGEAGRGFSLVAARMQGLAEAVLESIKGIKALTTDIREATQATVLTLEEATKLAKQTAQRAQQIALVCQQQRTGTEQVALAMDDIANASGAIAAGSDQTATASRDLAHLASDLTLALDRFSL